MRGVRRVSRLVFVSSKTWNGIALYSRKGRAQHCLGVPLPAGFNAVQTCFSQIHASARSLLVAAFRARRARISSPSPDASSLRNPVMRLPMRASVLWTEAGENAAMQLGSWADQSPDDRTQVLVNFTRESIHSRRRSGVQLSKRCRAAMRLGQSDHLPDAAKRLRSSFPEG